MKVPIDFCEQFRSGGRAWLRGAIDPASLENLRSLVDVDGKPGARVSPQSALFQTVCDLPVSDSLAETFAGVRPERIVVFDKSPESNWALPWHQDRVIAMKEKTNCPGFTKWTCKSGEWHCEPPEHVLQKMLFVRVHLDDVAAENGAMEIAVGSHQLGKISKAEITDVVDSFEHEVTEASAGDVLVLSMLTLHRSRRSRSDQTRRALRVDYALER
ncbi:MAG: phytanoyl-CoA dioxygenase family protein [Paracoccaceae bacterium]